MCKMQDRYEISLAKGLKPCTKKQNRKRTVWKTGLIGTKARIIHEMMAILIVYTIKGTNNLPVQNLSIYIPTSTYKSNWQYK